MVGPKAQRIHLNAGVARHIDRHPHHLDQRTRRRREAVAAHQRDIVAAEAAREVAALLHVGHQQVGVGSEAVGDVPHRNPRPHEAAGMDDGPQRLGRDGERQHVLRMGVDDGCTSGRIS